MTVNPSPAIPPAKLDGRKEAIKTYIEQTKLLVTLASAFMLAPATMVALFKVSPLENDIEAIAKLFTCSEVLFVISVGFGYIVLGSIAGSQDDGTFDVYRPATRVLSILQILSYIGGLVAFTVLSSRVLHIALIALPKPT